MSDKPRSDASQPDAGPAQPAGAETVTAQKTGGEEVSSASPAGSSTSAPPSGEPQAAEAAADAGPSGGNGSPAIPSIEERLAKLEAEKAQLAKEKQDNWDRLLRTTADLDNVRKRTRREVDDARTEARSKVLREMLPVIDNLERAVEHAEGGQGNTGVASLIEGVKLVLRQFAQALERSDVTPIDAVGKPFDPNMHEAISQIETTEHAPGSVVQALQKGYTIGNRLLRPALVVVAKAPPDPTPGSAGSNGSGPGDAGESGSASSDSGEA
jgi:molecular chaperone GrpE